jgi:putative nucleotidyltransferase with HDIG domain
LASTYPLISDLARAPAEIEAASVRTPWRTLGTVLGYPLRHIAGRIIGPFALLTLVFAATGAFITASIVGDSLQERFNNRLLESGRVAADSFVRQERKHLEVARAASFTEGVAAAVQQRDEAALGDLVLPVAANAGIDRIELLDASGEVVYGAARSASEPGAYESTATPGLAGVEIIARVLRGEADASGDKFSGLIRTGAGYVLGTTAPIYDGDTLVGAILVGTTLETLLPATKVNALADVTFYSPGGAPLASTFAGDGQSAEADLTPAGSRVDSGAFRETRSVFGRDYSFLYADLKVRGSSIGLYSVALSNDFVTSAGGRTAGQMAVLFGAGTVIVFVVGWLIARSLTQPLMRLLRAALAVTRGDLTARSGIRQTDEIGQLAGAFDTMTQKLQSQHLGTIRALTSAIDARDQYTLGHSVRVAQLAVELGRHIGLPGPMLQNLEIGGYLHDIGKIGIRDAILLKPSALTDEERTLVQDHPRIGLHILEAVEFSPEVIQFVAGHHERLDGSGYPLGLQSEEITIVPRIGAVADFYDALTTDRPYRRALTPEDALALLTREVDKRLLDPRVVDAMKAIVVLWEERRRDDESLKGFAVIDPVAA